MSSGSTMSGRENTGYSPLSVSKGNNSQSAANSPLTIKNIISRSLNEASLSSYAQKMRREEEERNRRSSYLNWDDRRKEILREYTLTGKISVSSIFLNDEPTVEDPLDDSMESIREKLAQLEGTGRVVSSVEVTQNQYEQRIAKLHKDLQRAWSNNHRVASIKIVIQCTKLLCSVSVPQFYPSMFVLVSEVLDTFGSLLFSRLKSSAEAEIARLSDTSGGSSVPALPQNFTARDIGPETKELAKNWLYKISCVRELIPRLYLELAFLRTYRFLTESDFTEIITRLGHTIRGIGNPIVAAYARLYLVRMADQLLVDAESARQVSLAVLSDLMFSFHDYYASSAPSETGTPASIDSMSAASEFKGNFETPKSAEIARISTPRMMYLLEPAFMWIARHGGFRATREAFQQSLKELSQWCLNPSSLRILLVSFPPEHYVPHASELLQLIQTTVTASAANASTHGGEKCLQEGLSDMYCVLAQCVSRSNVSPDASFRTWFLNEYWRQAKREASGNAEKLTRLAVPLVPMLRRHYSDQETQVLLQDLLRQLQKVPAGSDVQAHAHVQGQLQESGLPQSVLNNLEVLLCSMVESEVVSSDDYNSNSAVVSSPDAPSVLALGSIVSNEAFARMIDLFPASKRSSLALRLLTAANRLPGSICDPASATAFMDLCRTLHDSVDLLNTAEERERVSDTLSQLIQKLDFGRDLERLLQILTEFRGFLTGLDGPKQALVTAARDLSLRAHALVRGNHNRKSAHFVRAVFAFIFITIPSVDDPFTRISLYETCGHAALVNHCVSQADSLFRAAVQEIPELSQSIAIAVALQQSNESPELIVAKFESKLMAVLGSFAEALVCMPGSPDPEVGALYLPRGLFNAILRFPWGQGSSSCARARALLLLLKPLVDLGSSPIPNTVPGVDANDVLFRGDPNYVPSVIELERQVIEVLVNQFMEAHAARAFDPFAKAVLLEVIPEFADKDMVLTLLSLDSNVLPAVEKARELLRDVAPNHPILSINYSK